MLSGQLASVMTADTVTWPQCPSNCNCAGSSAAARDPKLVVDCHGRTEVDREKLSNQLDSVLSSNLTYDRLSSLSIVNSPLTDVPRSICRLMTLRELHLDNNRLNQLPDNCLGNLSNLIRFSVSGNVIDTLLPCLRWSQENAIFRTWQEQDRFYRFVGICNVIQSVQSIHYHPV